MSLDDLVRALRFRVERGRVNRTTRRWRRRLGAVGARVSISPDARLRGDWSKMTVGEGTAIGDFVHIWCSGGVTIGTNVLIAAHTTISSQGHALDAVAKNQLYRDTDVRAPVIVEDNVWIASSAVLVPGVRIGAGAIVAAGAVVLKDVPPRALVAGVPARIVRYLAAGDSAPA